MPASPARWVRRLASATVAPRCVPVPMRNRVSPSRRGAQSFLPLLRGGSPGSQRLRRVPVAAAVGRRAFLGSQTTTELTSSAPIFSTTNSRTAGVCSREMAIADQSSAALLMRGGDLSVDQRRLGRRRRGRRKTTVLERNGHVISQQAPRAEIQSSRSFGVEFAAAMLAMNHVFLVLPPSQSALVGPWCLDRRSSRILF
jgi:hypothetical protein